VTTTSNHSLNASAQTGAMDNTTDPEPEVPGRARGPRRYSASYKARVLEEYERLDKAGKGALLRREGLYTSLLSEWRKQRDVGRCRRWPSRRDGSRPIPATSRSRGCVGRTSVWPASWTRPAR
jgi:hypothetical protein